MTFSHHSFGENIKLLEKLSEDNGVFYFGIDPTAPHIHLGHLIVIQTAIKLIKLGWKCIVLIGGFTAQIGDPTGKDKTRSSLKKDITNKNGIKILQEIRSILDIYKDQVIYLNNKTWLDQLSLAQYLEYAKDLSVNKKIKLHTFADRLKDHKHLSMSEFVYSDIQAYDFYHLYRKHNCTLQIGGGDQWGNISLGVQLMRKICNDDFHGICAPLLTIKGKKMGKTTNNAVNVYNDPMDFIAYLRSMPDATKTQLENIFNKNYIEHIIKMIYQKEEGEKYIKKYEKILKIKSQDIQKGSCMLVHSNKLSSILKQVFELSSGSEAKRDIKEYNCVFLNDQLIKNNILLERGICYKITYKKHFIRLVMVKDIKNIC